MLFFARLPPLKKESREARIPRRSKAATFRHMRARAKIVENCYLSGSLEISPALPFVKGKRPSLVLLLLDPQRRTLWCAEQQDVDSDNADY